MDNKSVPTPEPHEGTFISVKMLLMAVGFLLYVGGANPHDHGREYFMGLLIGSSIGMGLGKYFLGGPS